MTSNQIKTFTLWIGLVISQIGSANGILLNDDEVRDNLNWLSDQNVVQLSTSTFPLSDNEIQSALSAAQPVTHQQQWIIEQTQRRLQRQPFAPILRLHLQNDQVLPQTFAQDVKAKQQLALWADAGGESWDARLQINAERQPYIENNQALNVEGSYLAGKLGNQWLIAGQIPTWWGPGQQSLIRGDASRPLTALTVQRDRQRPFQSPFLSWIGPWQYQLFAGRLQDYQAVPQTNVWGMRLTARPLPYLELGASRVLQMGGKGQPNSFKAYWNALIGQDNYCDTKGCVNDKNASNQLAGFDFKLNLHQWTKQPLAIYGQYIGEDEANLLPAKSMYLLGANFSSLIYDRPYHLYVEGVNTKTSGQVRGISYNHHQYTDGYYQQGYPLGAAIGGDSEMYTVGGMVQLDPMNRINVRLGTAKINQSSLTINRAFAPNDRLNFIETNWRIQAAPRVPIELKLWFADSAKNGTDVGAGLQLSTPLDDSLLKLVR